MYELRFVCNVYTIIHGNSKSVQKITKQCQDLQHTMSLDGMAWHGMAFRLTGQQLSQQMEIINSYGHRSQSPAHRMLILKVNIDYTYLCISVVDYQFDVYADILYGWDWWCG